MVAYDTARQAAGDAWWDETRQVAYATARAKRLTAADADDVAQHTLEQLARARTEDKTVRNATAYARTVAGNDAVSAHRRRSRGHRLEERVRTHRADAPESPSPERDALDRERVRLLQSALRPLLDEAPANYARALRRRYLEGASIEAIAEELLLEQGDLPTDPGALADARQRARATVDAHLSRGRRWMRKRLPPWVRELLRG